MNPLAMSGDPTLAALLGAVFMASLIGSVHCAGMCGGLCLFAVADPEAPKGRPSRAPHAAYHAGRGLSYAAVGVLAGSLGAAIDLSGNAMGLQRAAATLAGAAIILVGLALLSRSLGVSLPRRGPRRTPFKKQVEAAYRLAMRLTPTRRAAAVGLLTPLLPCGWLYAFAMTASATADPVAGGITMLVFWAGTLPLMVALGLGLGSLIRPLRSVSPVLTSATIVAVGVWTALARGPMPEAAAVEMLAARPTDTAAAIHAAESITPDVCPLCEPDE